MPSYDGINSLKFPTFTYPKPRMMKMISITSFEPTSRLFRVADRLIPIWFKTVKARQSRAAISFGCRNGKRDVK
jgi:hypothetical protein